MSVLLATNNTSTVLVIWAICIGVSLGFIYNFLSRAVAGPFVRALLNKKAIGEDKAVSLKELGFLEKKLIKISLRDGTALRNIVSVKGGSLPKIAVGKKTATDYDKARFYISAEKQEKASAIFGEKEKWYLLIIFVVLAVACAYGMTKVMPLLVDALF